MSLPEYFVLEPAKTAANPALHSNILSATGLPRGVLAAMFRRDGLFGRDSDLTRAEQAVVQSRLPAIPGLPTPAAPSVLTSRLAAIADFADARIAGRDLSREQLRLQREGLSEPAITEIVTVIGNLFAVFRPVTKPAPKASFRPVPAFAKAA